MSNVSDWAHTVGNGVSDALRTVVSYIPNLIGALVVLIVGVIIAYILKGVVVRLLKAIKIGPVLARVGFNKVFPGTYDFVDLLGDIVKWFFIVVFLLQALSIANLLAVSELVRGLLRYIPNVLAAAALVLVGSVVADLLHRLVMDTARVLGSAVAELLGALARWAVWVVVIFTALAQLGVNPLFLDRLFTAIVVMLALAGGLAFGLGGRDLAHDLLEKTRDSLNVRK